MILAEYYSKTIFFTTLAEANCTVQTQLSTEFLLINTIKTIKHI